MGLFPAIFFPRPPALIPISAGELTSSVGADSIIRSHRAHFGYALCGKWHEIERGKFWYNLHQKTPANSSEGPAMTKYLFPENRQRQPKTS